MESNHSECRDNFLLSFPKGRHHYPDTYEPLSKTAMKTGLNCVGYFWAVMSFLSLSASCVGFYMPYWIEGSMHNNTPTYIGLFRRCNYLSKTASGEIVSVEECGRYTNFEDIPSLWWQIGTITVGVGCGLNMLVTFAIILCCCVHDVISNATARVGGVLQVLSGLCVGTGCCLYPLGWTNDEVKQACGPDTDVFNLGDCRLSWAFFAAVGGAVTALLCALLSCHSPKYYKTYKSESDEE